jgi:hypothetical protein
MRKLGLIALAIAVAAMAFVAGAQARPYTGRHHYCGYGLHFDYSHGDALSPPSYVYPAANWGPFFQCHMYYWPVYDYPPLGH